MTIKTEGDGNCLSVLILSGIFFSLLLSHAFLFPSEDAHCPVKLTRKYLNIACVKVKANL